MQYNTNEQVGLDRVFEVFELWVRGEMPPPTDISLPEAKLLQEWISNYRDTDAKDFN